MSAQVFHRLSGVVAIIGTGLVLASCSHTAPVTTAATATASNKPVSQTITQTYHSIRTLGISGPVKLTLNSKAKHNSLLSFKRDAQYALNISKHGKRLNVYANSDQPVKVNLNSSTLHKIISYGNSSINAKNFTAKQLSIYSYGNSQVTLNGRVQLNRGVAKNNGRITVSWVNSNKLTVRASDDAKIKLSGVAKRVYAKLGGQSQLQARYLRANKMNVRTTNNASAKINPQHALYAFASGKSNVYYYHRPKHLTRYTKGHGNVLLITK
ncbi:MAG: DUF2807 domain-containing protein [Gammaproteobacteria bacterium]|nr:DUF2807 domain-containing protein [Gammaproteobacteria bacterium]